MEKEKMKKRQGEEKTRRGKSRRKEEREKWSETHRHTRMYIHRDRERSTKLLRLQGLHIQESWVLG